MPDLPDSAITGRRNALFASCRACSHVWIVAHLPMLLDTVAQLAKRAACPKCGDRKPNVAREAEIAAAGFDLETRKAE